METVTLTIDGRPVTVEKGKTVLQAAIESGISVPYYCYHPGISIDGSCRVCIVKIEKMPKLQTSCSTVCTEGMVVQTRTPDVVEARAGVFEFLLINHPLDCPVCDKGGECPLQDFSYTFGPDQSRMEFPRRTFDGEGVKADVDFGPTLMLNRNRCILCTRCVRFMRDVEGDAQINIIDRGYGSEIATFQEEGVHSLISGNLMDVCPVGAITTKDYRFKSRPWDNPNAVDTICTLCAKGCNTTAWLKAKPEWAKGSRLIRFTPRFNPDVNGYWMCDIGRFDYHWIEGDDRLRRPLVRDEHGVHAAGVVARADRAAGRSSRRRRHGQAGRRPVPPVRARVARRAVPVPPPRRGADRRRRIDRRQLALPAQGAARTHDVQGAGRRRAQRQRRPDARAGSRRRRRRGAGGRPGVAEGCGGGGPGGGALRVRSGTRWLDRRPRWIVEARASGLLPLLIVQGVLLTDLARAADFVLPGASFVEKEASYTNEQGRLQGAARAIPTPGEAMEDWQILVNLAAALGVPLDYASAAQIRADIAARYAGQPGFAEMSQLAFGRPIAAGHWLQASNPSERWKWDFMFQDLPPVKGAVDPEAVPMPIGAIPLREVKS